MTEIIKPILHVLANSHIPLEYCISILFLSEQRPDKDIPAVVTSENVNVNPANIFHRRQKLLLAGLGGIGRGGRS